MNWFQAKEFIKYRLKSGHWKGFGVHSPFVFEFINLVIREKQSYYAFNRVEAWRKALSKSKATVRVEDWGAGSKTISHNTKKISDLVKQVALPSKYGFLIFRIIERYQLRNILEIGTSLGMSTLYLALPNSKAKIITLEGSQALSDFATHAFHEVGVTNVEIIQGHFDKTLPIAVDKFKSIDFVFFDGNHRKEATLKYFYNCLTKANNNSIFIFDDIHWSKEMHLAWSEIIKHPKVTISIDLFRMGILFFRKESKKQHFTVHF